MTGSIGMSAAIRFLLTPACAVCMIVLCFSSPASADLAQVEGPQTRIVSGTVVLNEQVRWPFIAALIDDTGQFCGGSLIKPDWILTAAHCPVPTVVAIGRKKLSVENGELIAVTAAYQHPGYNASTNENDIALLKLDHTSTYAASAIALSSAADDPAFGATVSVAGWGTTYAGAPAGSDDLREANVEIVSNASCDAAYGGGVIAAMMLCASHFAGANSRDTCQGDSGGPLVYKDSSGTSRLVGITSWGNGCATEPYPGVYTRVSTFRTWIAQIIGTTVSVAPTAIHFGQQPVGADSLIQQVRIANTGTESVRIRAQSIVGNASFSIVSETCSTTGVIAPAGDCVVNIKFRPDAPGPLTGSLVVTDDSVETTDITSALSGFGIASAAVPRSSPTGLRLRQHGRSKKVGRTRLVVLRLSYKPPPQSNAAAACSGRARLSARLKDVRSSFKARGVLLSAGGACLATIKLRLPKGANGRQVTIALELTGNDVVAPSRHNFRFAIK